MATMYDYAVRYINMGLAVFPLIPKDKKPLTKNGCKDATTDGAIIKAWWQEHPYANIGIATGKKSGGIFVIDLDIDEEKGLDGADELKTWERENGKLPETWTTTTGRGGSHLFFRSEKEVRNRASLLDGVDVRGEGGYIVAPPSFHANGNRYTWDLAPLDVELAEANDIVYKFLEYQEETEQKFFEVPEVIGDGARNHTMFKMASSLYEKGFDSESILALLEVENVKKCVPPLDKKELQTIVKSVGRYKKGRNKFLEAPTTEQTEPTKEQTEKLDGKSVRECKYLLSLSEKGTPVQSIDNVTIAMNNDMNLKGKIFYNQFAFSQWIIGRVPWEVTEVNREWANLDDSHLKRYLEKNYGLFHSEKIMDGLSIVANENRFNPVCDFLNSLEWDGESHIENLLPTYLGVAKTRYSTEVMKVFMMGAINRAFHSGCKFDYMPVLVGGQGLGKSTFIKLLAVNEEWNEDKFSSLETDKAVEKLRSKWLVEFAELAVLKKAKEVESIKAFLTSTHDTYRPPYARRTESRARQCVFIGTTNNTHFLIDKTGNRRYLPLLTSAKMRKKSIFEDTKATKEEIIKAWAEAMAIYKSGEFSLVLPHDLQEYVEQMQDTYLEEDSRVGYIQEYLDNYKGSYVCVPMLFERALGNEVNKPTRKESNEIHEIMENSIKGWKRAENKSNGKTRFVKYGAQISYERVPTTEEEQMTTEKLPFE